MLRASTTDSQAEVSRWIALGICCPGLEGIWPSSSRFGCKVPLRSRSAGRGTPGRSRPSPRRSCRWERWRFSGTGFGSNRVRRTSTWEYITTLRIP